MMPWTAIEKAYEFEGPHGKVSLLDLFEGRRQKQNPSHPLFGRYLCKKP
jgi:predicted dithiol-disulfide oxidoreductase (DUF899 family)